MIPQRENRPVRAVVEWLGALLLRLSFSRLHIRCEQPVPPGPLVLVGPHISFWDGFWAWWLSRELLQRRFYVIILERELRAHPVLRFVGGFSLRPGEAAEREATFAHATRLLENPGHLVALFPEGRLGSVHQKRLKFRRGTEELLKRSPHTHLLFWMPVVEWFDKLRPQVELVVKPWEGPRDRASLEEGFNQFRDEVHHHSSLRTR